MYQPQSSVTPAASKAHGSATPVHMQQQATAVTGADKEMENAYNKVINDIDNLLTSASPTSKAAATGWSRFASVRVDCRCVDNE